MFPGPHQDHHPKTQPGILGGQAVRPAPVHVPRAWAGSASSNSQSSHPVPKGEREPGPTLIQIPSLRGVSFRGHTSLWPRTHGVRFLRASPVIQSRVARVTGATCAIPLGPEVQEVTVCPDRSLTMETGCRKSPPPTAHTLSAHSPSHTSSDTAALL